MCRWLEQAGVDYLHISAGGGFRTRGIRRAAFRPPRW